MMNLFAKDGSSKLVPKCNYPLTGLACVNRVYTNHALFILVEGAVVVAETFGVGLDELSDRLEVELVGPQDVNPHD
jgi:3-oxoadipate CoA-transferase beta subunit